MTDLEILSIDGKPFEKTDSGLVVPSNAIERERESWIKEEVKKLDKAVLMLQEKGVNVVLVCHKCQAPLQLVELEDGKISLRCPHADRVLRRDI